MTTGIGTTGIRAGVIKVAMSGNTLDEPFTEDEEKNLRAAARAQAQTGLLGHSFLECVSSWHNISLKKCPLEVKDETQR